METLGDLASMWALIRQDSAAWLLTYAAHSTLLLGLAWLCSRYVRPYRLKDILWKTALVGGVFTASLQVTLGVSPLAREVNLFSPAAQPEIGEEAPVLQITLPGPESDGFDPLEPLQDLPVQDSRPEAEPSDPIGAVPSRLWSDLTSALRSVAGWILGLWLIGAAVAILRLRRTRRRLYGALKDRYDVCDRTLVDRLIQVCHVAGIRKPVRLTVSPHISRPITLNGREICLPQRVAGLDADRQESLLAHELAHVKRRDPLWLMGSHLLESIFFFQPLHRLARRHMQECAEYLADDEAARYTGSGLVLARCLVEVAGWPLRYVSPATVAGMAASMSDLERRVRRLLDGSATRIERPRWWWTAVAVSLLALVVGVGPSISVDASTPSPASIGEGVGQWQVVRVLDFDHRVGLAGFSDERSGIIIQQPGGQARHTSDGGQTWNVLNECQSPDDPGCECQTFSASSCLGLEVVDGEVAWQCDTDTSLCLTTNGGETWQSIAERMPTSYPYQCRFLSFLDDQRGWSATPWRLLSTEDGGGSWTEIALPEPELWITTVALRTPTEGYVLDDQGQLYVTHDAGVSWSTHTLDLREGERLLNPCSSTTTMRFFDADHGVIVFSSVTNGETGKTWVAHTADGGQTWQRDTLPPIPEIEGSLYYHHLSHDGRILTVTGMSGDQIALLRYQAR